MDQQSVKPHEILAWHFVGARLRDGKPVPNDGDMLIHRGRVVPCKSGLHASVRICDALRYAPGATVCRVVIGGRIKRQGNPEDKIVGSERTILWRVNANEILLTWVRRQASKVVHLWNCPDVVREFLETGSNAAGAAYKAAEAAWAAGDYARPAYEEFIKEADVELETLVLEAHRSSLNI